MEHCAGCQKDLPILDFTRQDRVWKRCNHCAEIRARATAKKIALRKLRAKELNGKAKICPRCDKAFLHSSFRRLGNRLDKPPRDDFKICNDCSAGAREKRKNLFLRKSQESKMRVCGTCLKPRPDADFIYQNKPRSLSGPTRSPRKRPPAAIALKVPTEGKFGTVWVEIQKMGSSAGSAGLCARTPSSRVHSEEAGHSSFLLCATNASTR